MHSHLSLAHFLTIFLTWTTFFCIFSSPNLGRPQPRLTWWQENTLLDDSYTSINEKKVKNELQIEKLQRHHLNAVLTCQAANNNITAPISAPVSLNLNCKLVWFPIFPLLFCHFWFLMPLLHCAFTLKSDRRRKQLKHRKLSKFCCGIYCASFEIILHDCEVTFHHLLTLQVLLTLFTLKLLRFISLQTKDYF